MGERSAAQPLARQRDSTAPLGGRELHNLMRTRAGRMLVGAVAAVAVLTATGLFVLFRVSRPGGPRAEPAPGKAVPYEFAGVDRRTPLLWIAVIVAVLAAALLRWRGVLAVAGAALSLAVLVWFLVPAILSGSSALLVALVASLTVMFVTLVLTNGLGAQTLAAALGVSATLAVTGLLGWVAVDLVQLGTSADMELHTLSARDALLLLPAISLAALLVGALGVRA